MPSNAPPPSKTLNISLAEARKALESSAALSALVDRLEDLSDYSIHNMAPLVFDVVRLSPVFPAEELLSRMLDKRPEWIKQLENSQNLLSCALECNRFDLVDVLVDAGVDPAYENISGFGVLDRATTVQFDPQVQESCGNSLLKSGACSSAQKDKALKKAVKNGNLGMVKSLIAHGAGFSVVHPHGSVIATACDTIKGPHQLEIVQALLQVPGADQVIDHGWDASLSAIHRAASTGNVPVVSMLLAAGARVNPPEDLQSRMCETPLMTAAGALRPEVMSLLIKSGAEANAIDGFGQNAFHYLAGCFSWEDPKKQKTARLQAIAILFDADADPTQQSSAGMTPLDRALSRKDPAVIELFMALEAQAYARRLGLAIHHPAAIGPKASRRL